MANRSSVRTFPRRSVKRKTVWVGTAIQGSVAIGSGLSVAVSSFSPSALGILAGTVVRTRGLVEFRPQAFGVDLTYDGAYGLAVVSDEAIAAGAASIPRPFDDDDWPGWLVHGYYMGHFEFQSGVGIMMVSGQQVIDSKAMRKVGLNETLVWMVESNSSAVDVILHARVLMKLS